MRKASGGRSDSVVDVLIPRSAIQGRIVLRIRTRTAPSAIQSLGRCHQFAFGKRTFCPASQLVEVRSTLINIPKPGHRKRTTMTGPESRRAISSILRLATPTFHGDVFKGARSSPLSNLTKKYALYNFLFNIQRHGTNYLTSRTFTEKSLPLLAATPFAGGLRRPPFRQPVLHDPSLATRTT